MTTHLVRTAADASWGVPPALEGHVEGYRRWTVVDEGAGAVHTGFGIGEMEPGGRAQSLVASGTFFQPEQVARELVSMFGTRRVYRTMPVYRGIQTRLTALAPGPTMRLEPVLLRIGRRKIRQGRFT